MICENSVYATFYVAFAIVMFMSYLSFRYFKSLTKMMVFGFMAVVIVLLFLPFLLVSFGFMC